MTIQESRESRRQDRFEPENDQSAIVPANEETERATGALDAPATPSEMTKDGKVDSNRKRS